MIHEIKSDPKQFMDIWNKMADFTIRYNDRGYKVGDTLIIRETLHSHEFRVAFSVPLFYTGYKIVAEIDFVSRSTSSSALFGENYVIISFKLKKWIVEFNAIKRSLIDGKKRLIKVKGRKGKIITNE